MMFASNMLTAQQLHVFEEWAQDEGVQEFFYRNVTATDSDRSVYVAGATLNQNGDYDLLITKYNRDGDFLWKDTIAGPSGGHDFATDLVIDGEGNVVVCGSISQGGAQGQNMLVVKYDPDGFEYWRYSHDYDNNNDAAASVCVNSSNRIFVTGATQAPAGYADMLTIHLNFDGSFIWEKAYDYNELHDIGVKILPSGSDVIVTGIGQQTTTNWRVMALNYAQSDGGLNGMSSSGSGTVAFEEVRDMVIDDSGNIYLVGSTLSLTNGMDVMLIKLDDELNIEWTQTWDGSGQADHGYGVRVAPNGDVYVCGTTRTTTQGDDALLLKYNASGSLVWSQTYNGSHNGDDTAESMEWHPDGYLYLTGSSYVVSNLDYLTLKYDTTGALLWEITYNSPSNKNDRATNMAIDDDGDIIVSGQCEINDSTTRYYTVKYVEKYINDYNFGESGTLSGKGGFVRNNGQILTEENTYAHDVQFYSTSSIHPLFMRNEGWSIVQHTNHDDTLLTDTILKIDFDFINPLPENKVRAYDKVAHFSNFYSTHFGKIERVPEYERIIYRDVWREIDVIQISAHTNPMVIVAKPFAKLEDIRFEISGHNQITVDSLGKVIIHTYLEAIELPSPVVYQNNDGNLEELSWAPEWSILGSELSLTNIGTFDQQDELVILIAPLSCLESDIATTDELCYSSYFGGWSDDWTNAMLTSDGNDRIVAGFSGSQYFYFPSPQFVTPNVQITGASAYITRFGNNFNPIYTSILLGTPASGNFSSEIYLYDANVHDDMVFACGVIWGSIPQFGPQVSSPSAGFHDAYILGFDVVDGNMFWSTILGGTGGDVASGLSVDNEGKITLVGTTEGLATGFPFSFTADIYNTLQSGQSGFIARFSADLELEWCNAFGGSGIDGIFCIDHFSDNGFVVGGKTNSTDLYIEPVAGSYQILSKPDDNNYFLARFNEAGEYIWSTYIKGETVNVQLYTKFDHKKGVAASGNSFYFGAGLRELDGFEYIDPQNSYFFDEPAPPLVWLHDSRNRYSFVKRFNSANDLVWSTLLGEGGYTSEVTFITARHNKLYIGGISGTPNTVLHEISPYYFRDELPTFDIFSSTLVSDDAFLAVFDDNQNNLMYGTLLGGYDTYSANKRITGILVTDDYNIFISGDTKSSYTCNTDYPREGIPVNQGYGDFYLFNNPGWFNLQDVNRSGFITHFCFDLGSPLSLEDFNAHSSNESEVIISPNPSNIGHVQLRLKDGAKIEQISIHSMNGQEILNYHQGGFAIQIDVSSLSYGLYIARVYGSKNIYSAKFIIY